MSPVSISAISPRRRSLFLSVSPVGGLHQTRLLCTLPPVFTWGPDVRLDRLKRKWAFNPKTPAAVPPIHMGF